MLNFKVHGKWILAGEHSVLRGAPALVFPISSKYLEVSYVEGPEELQVSFVPSNNELHIGFWSVFEKALEIVGKNRSDVTGRLTLTNNIPIGAGMGASATLCVGVAKLFNHLNFIDDEKLYDFAKSLEDLFHGKSSGVDVAVALNNEPLAFKTPDQIYKFSPQWKPKFYLSFCGKRAVTSDCVKKVESLFNDNQVLAESLDLNMADAVNDARSALETDQDLDKLKSAIDMAGKCFEGWQLVSKELEAHMADLKAKGAIAVKPTGSGEGGYVLSLWDTDVDPNQFSFEMIPC